MVSTVAKEDISAMERVKSDGEVLLGATADQEEDEEVMLPGYRFHPTDEELVTFYLRRKVARKALRIEVIREMDIYKHDPWDLPKASTVGGEKEWYFFCLRGRKYRNSIRPNRVTGSGFWKATGIDRPIYPAAGASSGSGSGESIGLKKSLVYYRGSAGKGTKTDWMMHEFRLPPAAVATNASPSMQEAEVWTICRIFRRTITYRKQQQPQQQTWRPAPATAVAESSSNTGSFESSEGGDEYMNCLAPAPAAAPCIPQQQQHHHVSQMGTVNNNVNFFYRDAMQSQQFQGQWDTLPAVPVPEQKPLNRPSTSVAFHQNDHSHGAAATNDYYKVDGYLEEIARMMEVNDPATVYDCRSYA